MILIDALAKADASCCPPHAEHRLHAAVFGFYRGGICVHFLGPLAACIDPAKPPRCFPSVSQVRPTKGRNTQEATVKPLGNHNCDPQSVDWDWTNRMSQTAALRHIDGEPCEGKARKKKETWRPRNLNLTSQPQPPVQAARLDRVATMQP